MNQCVQKLNRERQTEHGKSQFEALVRSCCIPRVSKTKGHAEGTLERFKARLVACGNEQAFGVDYTMTISVMMEITTVEVMLALARAYGVPARHGDVPNAFVKADKEEGLDIAFHVPQGIEFDEDELNILNTSDKSKVALKLLKSNNGLSKQNDCRHNCWILHSVSFGLHNDTQIAVYT